MRIVVQEEGESLPNNRRSRPSLNDDPPLCATLYTAGGVGELYLRRSTFFCSRSLSRPPPHQDWGRTETAGYRLARDDKEPEPQLGEEQLPGDRPRETAET